MTTSSQHAVLFTKERCGPCIKTKKFLDELLEFNPGLAETISVLKIENHTALREAYDLNTFPTLLITGPGGLELDRVVGGRLIRDCIEERLTHIYQESRS